jgi:hypothetical protein
VSQPGTLRAASPALRQCLARRRHVPAGASSQQQALILPDAPEGIVRMPLGQGAPAMLHGKVEMSATTGGSS